MPTIPDTVNPDGTINRWSVYQNSNGEYIIVKELLTPVSTTASGVEYETTFSYTHAVKNEDDLEEFLSLITSGGIDDMFD